jgi:FkbM family methyltransferase
MTFVDIGANEDLFAVFAARRIGNSGRVIAIEPSTRERHILERNVARNGLGNVTIVPHALAAEPGTAELQIAPMKHGLHNTLGDFICRARPPSRARRSSSRVSTICTSVWRRGAWTRSRIDVEGAEVKVLTGGRGLLSTSRPILLVEVNEEALKHQGADSQALLALLRSTDYPIHIFNDRGLTERWIEGRLLSANIVAMPPGA